MTDTVIKNIITKMNMNANSRKCIENNDYFINLFQIYYINMYTFIVCVNIKEHI